jgi:hypothetical protein
MVSAVFFKRSVGKTAAGPRQHSHSWLQVSLIYGQDLRPLPDMYVL